MKYARLSAIALAVLMVSSCGERPNYGGEKESSLVSATAAPDVGKVREGLASGADPNKMVTFEGHYQSPWRVALEQLRPRHPELVEIVKLMLKAGANLEGAWGTGTALGISRRSAANPMMVVMLHPDPEVVRALMDAGLDRRLGQTALVMAIEGGETEIAHILVDAGVNVNCHPGGNTPLVAAIEARNEAMMTYLEEHGAREKP